MVLVVHIETQRHYHVATIDIALLMGGHCGGRRDLPCPCLHRPQRAYRRHLVHFDVESTAGAAGSSPSTSIAATMIAIAFVIDVTACPNDYFARLSNGLVDYLITLGA